MSAPNGLVPFTSDTARAAGLRSADARRARKLAGRANAEQVASDVRTLAATYERGELGPIAIAAAVDLIGRVARGDVPIRNGSEAADLIRALVDIGRLEGGEAQRSVAIAHLSGPALATRLRELQRDDVSAAVSAVADRAIDVQGSSPPADAG